MNALPPITALPAVARWFNPARGYGFVTAPGIPGDILLHQHHLEAAGRSTIAEGAGLTITVRATPNGHQVERIISIDAPAPVGPMCPARVRWFNAAQGYGFVTLLGQPGDVFLGRDTLRKAGRDSAAPGEALAVVVARGDRGPVVDAVGEWV
jgi:CspA family cold shock protein